MYRNGSVSVKLLDWREYVELCVDFIEHLRPDIAIERFASQAAPELLEVSVWKNIRSYHVTNLVQNKLVERNTFQGKLYKIPPQNIVANISKSRSLGCKFEN